MKRAAILLPILLFCLLSHAWGAMPVTKQEVLKAQDAWGAAVVAMGEAWAQKKDYRSVALQSVDELYGYDQGQVLFKPTKAAQQQFRSRKEDAVSYFVGGNVAEDKGFALQPWSAVRFGEQQMAFYGEVAVAMGNYYFTDANTGKETKVEFTFGYYKDKDEGLRIFLHHSSLPYAAH